MLIHLNEVLSCEEKTVAKNVDLEMNSFDSGLGSFPFLEKEPVALTIPNLGEDKLKITGSVRLDSVTAVWRRFRPLWSLLSARKSI